LPFPGRKTMERRGFRMSLACGYPPLAYRMQRRPEQGFNRLHLHLDPGSAKLDRNSRCVPEPGLVMHIAVIRLPHRTARTFNLFRHAQALLSHHSHPGRRNERQSLYWRSKRNLPRDLRRGRAATVGLYRGPVLATSPRAVRWDGAPKPIGISCVLAISAARLTAMPTTGKPVPGGRSPSRKQPPVPRSGSYPPSG
jgi:hypothetical protein